MLGENIKKRRLQLKMSQDELAKVVGYDNRASISKIESNLIDLNISKVKVFARALHCTPSELMGWTKEDEETNSTSIPRDYFTSPQEAVDFLLNQNVIMGYNGLDITKLTEEEQVEYANEILNQIKLVSYKYKD